MNRDSSFDKFLGQVLSLKQFVHVLVIITYCLYDYSLQYNSYVEMKEWLYLYVYLYSVLT